MTTNPRPVLMPHQERLLQAARRLATKGGTIIYIAPTGSGKTIATLAALEALGYPKTLVVAPTRELVDQWLRRAAQYGARNIDAVTYQYGYRHVDELCRRGYRVLVEDEAHHAPADAWRAVLEGCRWHLAILLTATLERYDGRHRDLLARADEVVRVQPGELAGSMPSVELVWVRRKLPREKLRRLRELQDCANNGDYHCLQQLALELGDRDALRLAALIAAYEAGAGRRGIVYLDYIWQADVVAEALRDAGYPAAPLHSRVPGEERRRLLRDLSRGDLKILTAVAAADEGIDIPELDFLVMLRPVGRRRMVQRLGRLARLGVEGSKRAYVLFAAGLHKPRGYGSVYRVIDADDLEARILNGEDF